MVAAVMEPPHGVTRDVTEPEYLEVDAIHPAYGHPGQPDPGGRPGGAGQWAHAGPSRPPHRYAQSSFSPAWDTGLPTRRPGTAGRYGQADLPDHRYEALEAWSESAETITLAAVGVEALTTYPRGSAIAGPRHAAPPDVWPSRVLRTRRGRTAVLSVRRTGPDPYR